MQRNTRLAIVAAVASVCVFTASSFGQFRVGDDGRALDANPRIGSGGYNDNVIPPSRLIDPNQVITGNVTGGREFRVPVVNGVDQRPYRDVREFRGTTGSETTDRFIRNSSGVPMPYRGPGNPSTPEVFYGRTLAAPPPPGFTQNLATGTYSGYNPPGIVQPNGYVTTPNQGGLQSPLNSPNLMPRPGELMMPGPVDPQTNRPLVTSASPLLGVRRFDVDDLLRVNTSGVAGNANDALQPYRLDSARLTQMRQELERMIDAGRLDAPAVNPQPTAPEPRPGDQRPSEGGSPAQPLENSQFQARPMSNVISPPALNNEVRADQGISFRLPGAEKQSGQVAEMQKRLDRYYLDRLPTDEEKHREFRKQLEERQAPPGGAARPGPQTRMPDYAGMSRSIAGLDRAREGAARARGPAPEPIRVRSLATGVTAEGLAKLFADAEELMRQGKYGAASERYGAAVAVAPNNPLAWLGQSHALLAGGYFRRAEAQLRTILQQNPSLLVGQYDLKAMVGADRIEAIGQQLKELANRNSSDDGPVLLLAYLAYNAGYGAQAEAFLGEAEKRAAARNAPAEIYPILRAHWKLGGGGEGQPATRPAAGAAATLPLTEVLQQFEQGNVASATLSKDLLSGQFRKPIEAAGATGPVVTFRAELPAGAAGGPLGKWIQDNARGAAITVSDGVKPAALDAK